MLDPTSVIRGRMNDHPPSTVTPQSTLTFQTGITATIVTQLHGAGWAPIRQTNRIITTSRNMNPKIKLCDHGDEQPNDYLAQHVHTVYDVITRNMAHDADSISHG